MCCEPCKVAALIRWLFAGVSFYKGTNYLRPFLWYWRFISKFDIMAKAIKKKSAKEASTLFHNIMAASVSGNPKPEHKPIHVRHQFHTEEGDTELQFNVQIFEDGFEVTNIQVHSNFEQKIPSTIYLESDNEDGEIRLCKYYSKLIKGEASQVREWLDTPLSDIILEFILETVKEETQKGNG